MCAVVRMILKFTNKKDVDPCRIGCAFKKTPVDRGCRIHAKYDIIAIYSNNKKTDDKQVSNSRVQYL